MIFLDSTSLEFLQWSKISVGPLDRCMTTFNFKKLFFLLTFFDFIALKNVSKDT